MTGKDAVQFCLSSTVWCVNQFVSDLSDADLFARPVPGANHVAWQLGHLINAEVHLVKSQLPDAQYPELPAGFAAAHNKERSTADGPAGFSTKAEYLALFEKVRAATVAVVDQLSDADLDRPTVGPFAPLAPTLGRFLIFMANHSFMHAGQFTAVRRKLGKPVLF